MKKLLYSGLTVLMALFALVGLSRAQNTHTFTFNPPSGSTVEAGKQIQVTVSPAAEEISFEMFASMEDAQAATPSLTWDVYGVDGVPTVTTGNTVLKVAVNVGTIPAPEWEVDYAEYTVEDGDTPTPSTAPELAFRGLYEGATKYGRYVPFYATLMYKGEAQENFELYYSLLDGTTPSKDAYDDEWVKKAIATNGAAEIMLSESMAPSFKAVAYLTVDGATITSDNMKGLNLTALEVEKPEFDTLARQVEKNTVVRIKDNAGGATIYYSIDGETVPLDRAFDDDDPNVFKYDDEKGIVISEDMVIKAIAYKNLAAGDGDDDSFGIGDNSLYGGSEMLSGRFDIIKPAVQVALSTEKWIIGEPAPTVTITVPEGVTLGTEAGNVAVNMYMNNNNPENGWSQLVTESGAALDMTKATENGRDDIWTILFTLRKGDNPNELFEGDITVNPEMAWLEIETPGEKPAAPEFSVPSGEVDKGTSVSLRCATEGAKIYYTTGDLGANIPYETPFIINSDITIRAMSAKDGKESDIVSATYKVKAEPLPEVTITMTPAPGEIEAETEIDIEVSEKVQFIYYALYPTLDSANNDINPLPNIGFLYPEDGKPVPTVENPVVRVGVFRSAETPREIRQWDYAIFEYQIMKDIPKPIITPAGGEVKKGTEVEIKLAEGVAEGVKILYTVNDSLPEAGKDYTLEYTQKIVVNEAMTIKAMAFKAKTGDEEHDLVSNVAEASFTVKETPVVADTVKVPTFNPAAGEVAKDTKVAIACATEGAKIYYTVDGSVPTAESTEYTAEITIDKDMTVKAIAVKEGMVNSKVAEAAYTVKETANEGKELAGVHIYPNPSDGAFKVEVPVAAEVEIINTSGVVVKHATVAAGVTALRLENSGLYFVRFTANGQVAIKKLVVR